MFIPLSVRKVCSLNLAINTLVGENLFISIFNDSVTFLHIKKHIIYPHKYVGLKIENISRIKLKISHTDHRINYWTKFTFSEDLTYFRKHKKKSSMNPPVKITWLHRHKRIIFTALIFIWNNWFWMYNPCNMHHFIYSWQYSEQLSWSFCKMISI